MLNVQYRHHPSLQFMKTQRFDQQFLIKIKGTVSGDALDPDVLQQAIQFALIQAMSSAEQRGFSYPLETNHCDISIKLEGLKPLPFDP